MFKNMHDESIVYTFVENELKKAITGVDHGYRDAVPKSKVIAILGELLNRTDAHQKEFFKERGKQ